MTSAFARGLLVATMIMTPALLLPNLGSESTPFVLLVALLAGVLTFVEYNSVFPSIVEFRDAAPFNRLRFVALFTIIFSLSLILSGMSHPTLMSTAVTSVGTIAGNAIDFPYSPVRLVVLMLPTDATPATVNFVRTAAGISYIVSLFAMTAFLVMVRVLNWPARSGAFNVWVNLPVFDPTAGGDVVERLHRDARINIVIGFLLPFLVPAVVKLASDLLEPITLQHPQTLIWTIAAWAFLPASIIMRGIAMGKIADMIEEKRKRAYAEAELEHDNGFQLA